MTVTMIDGSVRKFRPPLRPVLCQIPRLGTTDVIDAETGEVLVEAGQWLAADVPMKSIEVDVTAICEPGGLADLRDSLTIAV
jgi:hypothetical protein